MARSKKRTFQSEEIKRIIRMKRLTWLIPLAIAVILVLASGSAMREQLRADFSPAAVLGYVVFILVLLPVVSVIPFRVARAYVHRSYRELMKNNSFHSVQELDYYRDKLEGLSPGTISLLMDLKLEPRKDVAAYLLRFEEMGLLRCEDGCYYATERYAAGPELRPSERYLIDRLLENNSDVSLDTVWQRMVEQEAVEDGYLTGGKGSIKGQAFGCLTTLLLFIGSMAVFGSISGRLDEMFAFLEGAEELSNLAQMRLLLEQPRFIPLIALLLLIAVLLLRGLCFPVTALVAAMGTAKHKARFKRTRKGNEAAEYIYGMKNFIRDYSNLSQADKEHLALWDDYLVYAVVLEENSRIVQEAVQIRANKIGR